MKLTKIFERFPYLSAESPLPYRIFFPLGAFWAMAGVGVWILHATGAWGGWVYPGSFHADAMIGGFVMALATGFLLTAVPKFTGARTCSNLELGFALMLSLGQLFCDKSLPGLFAFLMIFFARRFREREYSPPVPFLFVPLGLLFGFVGSLGIALGSAGVYSGSLVPFRALLFQGTILALVVGIGAKLIRVLLGYEGSPLVQIERVGNSASLKNLVSGTKKGVHFHVGLLALGFILEFIPGLEPLGRFLRAWVVTWVSFTAWQLHRLPKNRGALVWGLWSSCWSLWLGSVLYPFSGVYGIHVLHLIFIGGFSTAALMVASRVVLAHGGFPLELENRSRSIRAAWILALVAALSRFGAGFTGAAYFRHLLYAAVLFFAAVVIWTIWMVPKVAPRFAFGVPQPPLKEEC